MRVAAERTRGQSELAIPARRLPSVEDLSAEARLKALGVRALCEAIDIEIRVIAPEGMAARAQAQIVTEKVHRVIALAHAEAGFESDLIGPATVDHRTRQLTLAAHHDGLLAGLATDMGFGAANRRRQLHLRVEHSAGELDDIDREDTLPFEFIEQGGVNVCKRGHSASDVDTSKIMFSFCSNSTTLVKSLTAGSDCGLPRRLTIPTRVSGAGHMKLKLRRGDAAHTHMDVNSDSHRERERMQVWASAYLRFALGAGTANS